MTNKVFFDSSILKNWFISYNPYTDLFQIYDNVVFQIPKSELLEKDENKARFLLIKQTNQPILLEIKNFYQNVGVDINNMEKSAILSVVKPFFEKYA